MKILNMNLIHKNRLFVSLTFFLLLAGCVTPPKIDTSKFSSPKTVVIEDIPRMSNLAIIGVYVPWVAGFHFSEKADYFFDLQDMAGNKTGFLRKGGPDYQQGAIAAGIMAHGDETQKKALLEYNSKLLEKNPGFDLRADFMKALFAALESRDIAATLSEYGKDSPPRLRWPARDESGKEYPLGPYANTPAVDADLLVQVSPIAFYNSPGPLNLYSRNVSVSVALFNGRTRQFIGTQTLHFSSSDSKWSYAKYDGLVNNIAHAAPALREALLSLVPQVADIVSGQPVK